MMPVMALKTTTALFLVAVPFAYQAAKAEDVLPIHYPNDLLPAGALARFSAHKGITFRVVFSPSRANLAGGTQDGDVWLWDATAGTNFRLPRRRGPVHTLAISPDGNTLAAGHYLDVHLWDLARGKELHALELRDANALAFCPDGKTLISGGADRTIRFWDVATGRETRRIKTDLIDSLAMAPDGKTLASGSYAGLIQFWDVASGRELAHWQPRDKHAGAARSLVYSPCGKMLASYEHSCTITLRDVATGKERFRLNAHEDTKRFERRPSSQEVTWGVNWVAFSPDGKVLASAGNDKKVILWDVATGAEAGRFEGHQDDIYCVTFSPDGKVLASTSRDGTVLLWDATLRLKEGREPLAQLEPKDVAKRWEDLMASDVLRASRACWALVAAPEQATAFLKEHVRPTLPPDARRVAQLLADLDSDTFPTRQAATRELIGMMESARPALHAALEKQPPLEVRRRIEQILQQSEESAPPPPEHVRLLRSIKVLEHIGTAEARRVLESVARGVSEARLTWQARAALQRLANRPSTSP